MRDDRHRLGAAGERAAERFLRRERRFVIVARNYRCPSGEVDLVALDRGAVVFIEVKTRRSAGFGGPADAVDRRKQRRIVRAARHFMATHRLGGRDARFDVVAVWWERGAARCELIEGAFEADA